MLLHVLSSFNNKDILKMLDFVDYSYFEKLTLKIFRTEEWDSFVIFAYQ